MTAALLDLNDSNLQLWHKGQAVQSPGYALLDGKQYTFGSAARSAARLRPRDINTRYWWQLNTEGLRPALGPARHSADLVHAHLLDIYQQAGKPGELVLAVSGSMQRDQLALLLGIVEQCPFDAVGLVNRSVALGALYSPAGDGTGSVYHLEIQLHQAVISELAGSSDRVEMRRAIPLPGCGLLQLQERLVEIIAAAFVRQTRFDPRRKADSEQQLYDALPSTLQSLGKAPETNIEVMGYRARINRTELQPAGGLLLTSASEAMGVLRPDDRVIADPLAGLLPGLMEQLPRAQLVGNRDLSEAVEQHIENLVQNGEELHFVTSLPRLDSRTTADRVDGLSDASAELPAAGETPVSRHTTPSHLLVNAVATPLSPAGVALSGELELYCQQGNWMLRGEDAVQVNGENYNSGQVLHCGDKIEYRTDGKSGGEPSAEVQAQLIAVIEP